LHGVIANVDLQNSTLDQYLKVEANKVVEITHVNAHIFNSSVWSAKSLGVVEGCVVCVGTALSADRFHEICISEIRLLFIE